MTRCVVVFCMVFGFAPGFLCGEPAPFDFAWEGGVPLRIEPTDDGGIVITTKTTLEDASVPLLEVLHGTQGCEHIDAEHADVHVEEDVRVLAKKWVHTDEGRHLFVAWSPHHTCTAEESTHYFKIVDGNDFSRVLGSASRVWRSADGSAD